MDHSEVVKSADNMKLFRMVKMKVYQEQQKDFTKLSEGATK